MITKQDLSWIKTNEYLIVHFKGKPCQLKKDSEKYERVIGLIKRGRNKEIAEYLFPQASDVEKFTAGAFRVDPNGQVYVKGVKEPVHDSISKYLLEFYRNKQPYMALVKFWENLSQNPSQESREQLYLFLRANRMPITLDGCFLAYKKVTRKDNGHLYDSHTGSICNDIGKTVRMARADVDPNRHNTCSHGLHVAAWGYAQSYSGDTLLEVKVNPKHVVAVPNDYNNEKMRVCEYIAHSLSKSKIEAEYIAPETLRIKRKASKAALKNQTQATGKGQTVSFKDRTAKEIVDLVLEKTKQKITLSLKSKEGIINKGFKLLKKFGFSVRKG